MLSSQFKPLNAFLFTPSKELYGREIERLVKTTHERTVVYLNKLVEMNILFKEKKGKQVFYRLNKKNEFVLKSLSVAELERRVDFMKKNDLAFIIHDTVEKALELCENSVYFVVLFGSVARGEHRESSDIDLLFVLSKNGKEKTKIEKMIKNQEIISGKNIQLHTVTIDELEKRWLKEPVYKNIWDERIIFFGEENFWRFVLKKGEPL